MSTCIICGKPRSLHGGPAGTCPNQVEGELTTYFWAKDEPAEEREGNVGEVIDRRVQVYGNPLVTFPRMAEVWSGILGHEVSATDVLLCMIGMKMVRAQVMPDYSDNSDDIEGYLDLFRQLVGDEMIHARTVNEFIEMKWGES